MSRLTPQEQWAVFESNLQWMLSQPEPAPKPKNYPASENGYDYNTQGVHYNDDSDFWSGTVIQKHYGPGDHPGSKTPQSVHGSGEQSLEPRSLNRTLMLHGGFTVEDPSRFVPKKGWVTALAGAERAIPLAQFKKSDFTAYRDEYEEQLRTKSRFLGAWIDTEDGVVYLDVSIVLQSQEEATKIGRLNGQRAIYNLETGQEVRL